MIMMAMMIMIMIIIMIIRVALVERDISFTPDMSVRQTLLFHRYRHHMIIVRMMIMLLMILLLIMMRIFYGNFDFSLMREPGTLTRGRDTKGRINALIEDLGLSQVSTMMMAMMAMMMMMVMMAMMAMMMMMVTMTMVI